MQQSLRKTEKSTKQAYRGKKEEDEKIVEIIQICKQLHSKKQDTRFSSFCGKQEKVEWVHFHKTCSKSYFIM